MCEALSGQSFHTGQIYAARYRITPLFASKLVNFCTYFRHLCIIEKRHPLLSFLLDTVVDIGLLTVGETLQCHHSADRPTDRPIPAMASRLSFSAIRLCHFHEILPNILVNNSTWGCPWSKMLTPNLWFDHGEYVPHNFAWLTATFFLSWGVLRGHKKPLRGVPAPKFSTKHSSWTLGFADIQFQLDTS